MRNAYSCQQGIDVTHIHALPPQSVENHPWQQRAREAGLTQKELAKLLGRPEITISRQLRGHFGGVVPRHVIAAIIAWEMMTEDQRDLWVRSVEKDA